VFPAAPVTDAEFSHVGFSFRKGGLRENPPGAALLILCVKIGQ